MDFDVDVDVDFAVACSSPLTSFNRKKACFFFCFFLVVVVAMDGLDPDRLIHNPHLTSPLQVLAGCLQVACTEHTGGATESTFSLASSRATNHYLGMYFT